MRDPTYLKNIFTSQNIKKAETVLEFLKLLSFFSFRYKHPAGQIEPGPHFGQPWIRVREREDGQ